MVYATDLKSVGRKPVGVQVPPPAPDYSLGKFFWGFQCMYIFVFYAYIM